MRKRSRAATAFWCLVAAAIGCNGAPDGETDAGRADGGLERDAVAPDDAAADAGATPSPIGACSIEAEPVTVVGWPSLAPPAALAVAVGEDATGAPSTLVFAGDSERVYAGREQADGSVVVDPAGALTGTYPDGRPPGPEELASLAWDGGSWRLDVARDGLHVWTLRSSDGSRFKREDAVRLVASTILDRAAVAEPTVIAAADEVLCAFGIELDGARAIRSVIRHADGRFDVDRRDLGPSGSPGTFDEAGAITPALLLAGGTRVLFYAGAPGGTGLGVAHRAADADPWTRERTPRIELAELDGPATAVSEPAAALRDGAVLLYFLADGSIGRARCALE